MGTLSLKKARQSNGFTIVELLVVVVVIAILAAITIVAYSGIQDRAKHTAVISAVDAWTKLLEIAKIEDGTYPASFTSTPVAMNTKLGTSIGCLGAPGAFPASGSFPADACYIYSIDNGATYTVMASALNDSTAQQLISHASRAPEALASEVIRIGSGTPEDPFLEIRGIIYISNSSTPSPQAVLGYYYSSDQVCPRGERSSQAVGSATIYGCSLTLK